MGRPEFSQILEELAHGEVNRQLSDQLADLTKAVVTTGKKGRIVLSLTLTREGSMCVIDPDIRTNKPQPGAPGTMFFTGKEGELLRDDPRQLDIRSVIKSPEPVVTQHDDEDNDE